MTDLALIAVMVLAFALAGLLRAAQRRRHCHPRDHLVTVVDERRVRDGFRRRYWIRCRLCEFKRGPYDSWHAAWLDLFETEVVARRAGRSAGVRRMPAQRTRR
jgi:hypothetical protein